MRLFNFIYGISQNFFRNKEGLKIKGLYSLLVCHGIKSFGRPIIKFLFSQ